MYLLCNNKTVQSYLIYNRFGVVAAHPLGEMSQHLDVPQSLESGYPDKPRGLYTNGKGNVLPLTFL